MEPSQRAPAVSFENARDRLAFERLIDAMRHEPLFALAGAGIRVRAGFPGWEALLDRMHARADEVLQCRSSTDSGQGIRRTFLSHRDLLWRAQEYRTRMGESEYFEFLRDEFEREPEADPGVDAVVALPFRHVLTTNLDASFRKAHQRVRPGEPYRAFAWDDDIAFLELIDRLSDARFGRRYVHLHGTAARPEATVLTDHDYVDRYGRDPGALKRLFAVLGAQRAVCVGFGMEDPDLDAIFGRLHGQGYSARRHFALVGIDRGHDREIHRRRLLSKYGIETVFYDRANGEAELLDMLRALHTEAAGAGSGSAAATAPLPDRGAAAALPAAAAPALRVDPVDSQRGRWGGAPERNGRRLRATVQPVDEESDWYRVDLAVEPTDPSRPLAWPVTFHLPDTFRKRREVVSPDAAGRAALTLWCYGAFTVGAEADQGGTALELDLAATADAPIRFREG